MKELWNKFNTWVNGIAGELNVNPYIIMAALGFLVLLVIVLIIVLIACAGKKKGKEAAKNINGDEESAELKEDDSKDLEEEKSLEETPNNEEQKEELEEIVEPKEIHDEETVEPEEVQEEKELEEPQEENAQQEPEEVQEEKEPEEPQDENAQQEPEEVQEEKEPEEPQDENVQQEPEEVQEEKELEEVQEENVQQEQEEPQKLETVEEVKKEPKQEEKTEKAKPTQTVKKNQPKKKETNEKPKPEVNDEKGEKSERQLGKYTISQEGINYRYRLVANNGELMGVSELYSSEEGCRKGIETFKKNAVKENIDYVQDKHGLFSFRVMSKQGRCLLTSANYGTEMRAHLASESLIRFAQTNKIVLDESEDHYGIEEFKEEVTPEEHGKFKIENVNDSFVYKLYANNGRVIATSQQYASIKSCLEALEKFRALVYEGKFFIFKDKNSKYQFKLYNKQKRLVIAGEVYDNKANAISAITSIKRFAKLAELVEKQ